MSLSLAKQPEVISLDPQLLGDVIENIRMVGRATGAEERADEIAEGMEARIEAVTARAADADTKPSVLHVEWADPLMCGGHWVPEMVDLAGAATPSATRTPAPSSWNGKKSLSASPTS